ncbi:MAG: AEC family transporter [Lachnospiraceae bacterium]|nr:AEC family transporter [Lachnospiraceae bacterium]
MISILLMRQIAALFIMIGMGFAVVKSGMLKPENSRTLSVLILYLIFPCVIVKSFQIDLTPEVRTGFVLALVAAFVIHILLLGICFVLDKIFHLDNVEKDAVFYSNCGNLLIPLVAEVLGEEWVIFCNGYICVQVLFLWTHGQMVMSGTRKADPVKILKNPNIVAMVIGAAMLLTGMRFPALVQDSLNAVSAAFVPACMLMIGMLLGNVKWKEMLKRYRIFLIVLLRMLVVPCLILLFCRYTPLRRMSPDADTIMFITFLAAAGPTATTITQMAQLFGADSEYAGAISILTTLSCIVFIPLMAFLYYL